MFSLSQFCIYGGVYMQSFVAPHSNVNLLSWEEGGSWSLGSCQCSIRCTNAQWPELHLSSFSPAACFGYIKYLIMVDATKKW